MFSNQVFWFFKADLQIHINIRIGHKTIDYSDFNLSNLNTSEDRLRLRLQKMMDQVKYMENEMNYQRELFNDQHRKNAISLKRIMMWSLMEVTIVATVFILYKKLFFFELLGQYKMIPVIRDVQVKKKQNFIEEVHVNTKFDGMSRRFI